MRSRVYHAGMDRVSVSSTANLHEAQRLIDLARAVLAQSNAQIVVNYLGLAAAALDDHIGSQVISAATLPAPDRD